MTDAQKKIVEALTSEVDNLVVENLEDQALGLPEDRGTLVFEGESADGPAVGTIDPDGTITWLTG